MELSVDRPGRAVTIDRARKSRISCDVLLQAITSTSGGRRLTLVGGLSGLVGLLVRGWPAAALLLILGVLAQVGWWWRGIRTSLRHGLDVGQTVQVDYARSGELALTDSTGQLWLPRGSVAAVVRYRGIATVFGRQLTFYLPGELLTEADVRFLEGHGEAPAGAGTPDPDLPLAYEVTADGQDRLVAAATRVVVRSADFVTPWVLAVLLLGFFVVVGSGAVIAGAALFCTWLVGSTLLGLTRTRRRLRTTYPVGLVVRASVTAERLLLSLRHGTRTTPWSDFARLRVTDDAVLLRRARGVLRADSTSVLPRALFDDEALAIVAQAVPRRF